MDPATCIIADRRALHRIPELGLELPLTADYCEQVLLGLGLQPRRIGCGLVADLGEGPCFAWRADMDGLPIQEETGLAYASTLEGRMHACGHDAHMAIALGLARHYTPGGASLPCRLRLVFQPGEEGAGGARHMIAGGALEGVDAIAGLHVGCIFPELPRGCFGTRKGPAMASCTFFTITFHGKGTHGACPDQGRDALLAACQLCAGLQAVRYGAASPVHPTVISAGSLHAGTAPNVIPEEAVLTGSFRATEPEDAERVAIHLRRLAEAQALACGVEVRVELADAVPVTVNRVPALVDMLAEAVAECHGPARYHPLDAPTLGGEDFADYLERVPGLFFFLATNPEGCTAPHHHPRFSVADEELAAAIPVIDGLIRRWAARH